MALARPHPSLLALAFAAVAIALAVVVVPSPDRPAGAAPAAVHDFTDPVFAADARGDITTIGNVATTCDPTYTNAEWSVSESAAACNGSRDGSTDVRNHRGEPMPPINNRLDMTYVDVDSDRSTFDSSTARLDMPAGAVVLWAGLHWNGALRAPNDPAVTGSTFQAAPPSAADRFSVLLRTPASSGYQPLSAGSPDGTTTDAWDSDPTDTTQTYAGFVDVTAAVKAGGTGNYTVADVQACRGFGGCFASWSITVAYAQRDLPARNLEVWHGWRITSPFVDGGNQEFTVAGITPPPAGPVNARIGVVQADGDRGLGPDSLDISSPSTPWTTFRTADRPLRASEDPDWFNSTTSVLGKRRADDAASPNYLSNLDQDIALEQTETVVHNRDRSLSFRIHTEGNEGLFSQVVHSAVEIHQPTIDVTKSVEPAGPVDAGDKVTWTIEARNTGIDAINLATITDPLPEGLELVPGSIRYAAGGPAAILGPKTEASGDDQVDVDPATGAMRFRIGDGADGSRGGTMGLPGAADGSDRITITFEAIVDADPGTRIVNVAQARGEGRHLDDPFGPLVTTDRDDAAVALVDAADLGIDKTDDDAVVAAVGDRFDYRFTVTNAGPGAATGVRIADRLDDRLSFVSGEGCTAEGQDVSCAIGDLAMDAEAEAVFTVEVVALPEPGESIPNLATVHGNEPDPDCVPATPTARCNHDDETTPRLEEPEPSTTSTTTTSTPTSSTTPPPPGRTTTPPSAAEPRTESPSVDPGPLPRTGLAIGGLVAVGIVTIGIGAAVLRGRRRLTA